MRITFVISIRNTTYNHYLKQPKPMGEINLNKILAKNQQLIIGIVRTINHTLVREYSIIPFNFKG